ncbi:MAG: NAD-dependent epimerase/dehydratase family protein [Deltaproteobacteria bacterium]|nr:NAD-dependent epimerase/dehydratase family protein [Deltaproteobacteria bacterium]
MTFDGISLVTGAAGFMGSHMVECLVQKGIRVRATSRPRKDTSFFDRLGVEYVAADLTRPETLPALFRGPVDRIFHLGAICNFSTPYAKLHPTNVAGVKTLSGMALEKGVKCFVHVTSTSVYGRYRGRPFVEDDPREPCNDYGRSKKNGEDVIFQRVQEGLPAVIARPCAVYGPRCNDGAGKVFSRPSSIGAVPGNGRQRLSNIRAEDTAAALLHLSLQDEARGEAYNLAEDTYPTLEEALVLAAQTFGTRPPTLHLPLAVVRLAARLGGVFAGLAGKIPDLEYDATGFLYDDYIVDNTKLKKTGFTMQYPDFTESMRQMRTWYQTTL